MQNVHFPNELLRSSDLSGATELDLLAVEQNPTKFVGRVGCWEFRQLQAGSVCVDRVMRDHRPVSSCQSMWRWSSEA